MLGEEDSGAALDLLCRSMEAVVPVPVFVPPAFANAASLFVSAATSRAMPVAFAAAPSD